MKPRVCIVCGESIPEKGGAPSHNPNLCASCSSLTGGMEESDTSELFSLEEDLPAVAEKPAEMRKAA
jgi:hypothetical protein